MELLAITLYINVQKILILLAAIAVVIWIRRRLKK